jgi:hypothetical protein
VGRVGLCCETNGVNQTRKIPVSYSANTHTHIYDWMELNSSVVVCDDTYNSINNVDCKRQKE